MGQERAFLRDWRTELHAVETTRWPGKGGLGMRMTLRSVLAMAASRGSRYVEVGVRGYAVGAGSTHGTVAEHLRALREEADPFLVLVDDDRGLRGDLYELRLPTGGPARQDRPADAHAAIAEESGVAGASGERAAAPGVGERVRRSWRRGRVYGCRPVFRVLGLPAALAYEQLEHHVNDPSGLGCGDIAVDTGLSRAAAYNALATLAAYDLAVCRRGRWHLGATTTVTAGRRLGADEDVAAQVELYRVQRRLWHAFLGIITRATLVSPIDVTASASISTTGSDPDATPASSLSRGSPGRYTHPATAGHVASDPELDRAIGLITRVLCQAQ